MNFQILCFNIFTHKLYLLGIILPILDHSCIMLFISTSQRFLQ